MIGCNFGHLHLSHDDISLVKSRLLVIFYNRWKLSLRKHKPLGLILLRLNKKGPKPRQKQESRLKQKASQNKIIGPKLKNQYKIQNSRLNGWCQKSRKPENPQNEEVRTFIATNQRNMRNLSNRAASGVQNRYGRCMTTTEQTKWQREGQAKLD